MEKIIVMDNNQTKTLLGKLRQPIHIDYIARYILKESFKLWKIYS